MADFAIGDIYSAIDRLAPSFGVDPTQAKMLLTAENTSNGSTTGRPAYSSTAVSGKQATGLMQVIPTTAEGLRQAGIIPADWRHDPNNLDSNIIPGLGAIKDMASRLKDKNDPMELAAYYNGGDRGWKNYLAGKPLAPETADYLIKSKRALMELGTPLTPQQIEQQAASGTSPLQPGMRTYQSGSTSQSRRTSEFDPAAFAAFQSALSNANTANAAASDAVATNSLVAQQLGGDLVTQLLATGEAAGESAKATAQVQVARMQQRNMILDQANFNPLVADNRERMALQQLDSTSAQIDALRPGIDKNMSTSLLDDPFGWLNAQFELMSQVPKYNALARQQGDQLARYQAAEGITDRQINRTEATQADEAARAGLALAHEAASKATAAATQQQLANVNRTTADQLTMAQLATQRVSAAATAVGYTRSSVTENQAETSRQAAMKDEQAAVDKINQVLVAAGGQAMTNQELKMRDSKTKTRLLDAGLSGRFGDSPGEALEFMDTFTGGLGAYGQKSGADSALWMAKMANDADRQVQTEMNRIKQLNPGKKIDVGEIRRNLINTQAGNYANDANLNLYRAPSSNPYAINYQQSITKAAADPAYANNSYVQTMAKLGPGGAESVGKDYDENRTLSRMMMDATLSKDPQAAIKKMAADTAAYYQSAAKENMVRTRYSMVGMPAPIRTYAMALPDFNKGVTFDMGDAKVLENMFTKQYVSAQSANRTYGQGLFTN